MALWRPAAALLGCAALLTGCGSLDSVIPPPNTHDPMTSAAAAPASSSPAPVDPDQPLAAFYSQQPDWRDCGGVQCATLTVPMDYADPTGDTVDLAMLRVPATGERYGTLFVNPGGPGGSATDYARAADYIVTPAVREHYDVVGVDPRGVAHSEPVRCLTSEQIDELIELDGTPDTPEEVQATVDGSREIGRMCQEKAKPLWQHMGTIDAARDMDVARAVVGDPKLNYLGKSYGTMLGQTYAQLFPENVGRMVLDGDLPTSLDAVETSLGQAEAFEVALADFVAYCLGQEGCPLSGTVEQGVQQVRDWLQGLDSDPIPAGDRSFNEPLALYAMLSYLYFPPGDYEQLLPALAAAMNDRDPGPMLALLDQRISRAPDGRYTDNSTDAFYAVSCLDRPFTGTVEDVTRLADEWAVKAPTFGRGLAWGLLACQDWPAVEEPMPTASLDGLPPILVVSTKNDPATPYQWGVQMAEELPGSVLLSWDGHQHTAYTQGSACIDDAVDAYLLDGTLPAAGTLCE